MIRSSVLILFLFACSLSVIGCRNNKSKDDGNVVVATAADQQNPPQTMTVVRSQDCGNGCCHKGDQVVVHCCPEQKWQPDYGRPLMSPQEWAHVQQMDGTGTRQDLAYLEPTYAYSCGYYGGWGFSFGIGIGGSYCWDDGGSRGCSYGRGRGGFVDYGRYCR